MAVSPVALKEVAIDIDSIKVKRKFYFYFFHELNLLRFFFIYELQAICPPL